MSKEIFLSQNQVAVVDDADFEWLNQWKWHAQKRHDNQTYYAARWICFPGGKCHIRMHRLILGINNLAIEIDHIDGDGLNNTRNNLRLATRQQNVYNRHKNRNNTSEYKGVSQRKSNGRWRSYINVDGKRIYLGSFLTAVEAAQKYNEAAHKFHGIYAKLNEI